MYHNQTRVQTLFTVYSTGLRLLLLMNRDIAFTACSVHCSFYYRMDLYMQRKQLQIIHTHKFYYSMCSQLLENMHSFAYRIIPATIILQ